MKIYYQFLIFVILIIGHIDAYALPNSQDSLSISVIKEKIQNDYVGRNVSHDQTYVPSFFSNADTLQSEDNFYELILSNYKGISIFYGISASNALCFDDEFPTKDTQLDFKCKVSSITYYSKRGVFSGYTNDGRIFYMKKRILKGDIPHPIFYGIIYPQRYNDAIKILINHIKDWTPDYTYDDMDSYYLRHLE